MGTALPPDPDLLARLRLASTPGLSPRIVRRLIERFGSPAAVLAAKHRRLAAVKGVGGARASLVTGAAAPDAVRADFERMTRSGVEVLRPGRPPWPEGLDELDDPPLVLYARGTLLPEDACCVAVIGSRRASRYGRRTARQLAGGLASMGVTVVSGLARGIDTEAHEGALAGGGRTLAILGGGLARLYPPENLGLARRITAGSGAVLTEFALDLGPRPYHFPRRNRIMAALARAVVVVEAGEKSGSLITVDHALDLGRDVLAVPGRVDAPGSRGTHRLLREGAAVCESAADVLAVLGIEPPAAGAVGDGSARCGAEASVLAALEGGERHADELVAALDVPPDATLAALAALELDGAIELGADGRYGKA